MPALNTAELTLRKIGNFIGLRFREIYQALSTKAERQDLEKFSTFFNVANKNELVELIDAKVNDFALVTGLNRGYRLKVLPASDANNWMQVFTGESTVTRTVSFPEQLSPVIVHDMNQIPSTVDLYDAEDRRVFAHWEIMDRNSIMFYFTETVAGRCVMTFQV